MADPTGPINVSTVNVQQANVGTIQRAPIMRQNVNTGERKTEETGETVILTDINETMGKVDDTIREYLGRIEDFIKDILDQGKPKQARPKEKIEPPEGPKSERDGYAVMVRMEQLLKGLNDHAELQRIEAETAQAEKAGGGARKSQANFDDRAQLTFRQKHYDAISKVYEEHKKKLDVLEEAYKSGAITLAGFLGNLSKMAMTYTVQKTAVNSLHVTTNRLRQSFASLTAGVDGVALMLTAIKERYNSEGGYKTMIQSGYGGLKDVFLDDLIPNFTRDSKYQTSKAIRENLKVDSSNEILTGGRSLETSSRQIFQAQKGVKDQGFDLLNRFENAEQKAALIDIGGTLKRANIANDINSSTATALMSDQLKAMLVAAANTGMTVVEIQKNTAAQRKKISNLSAAGILDKKQAALANELAILTQNNAGATDFYSKMFENANNPALFFSNNPEIVATLQSLTGDALGEITQMMHRMHDGTIDAYEVVAKTKKVFDEGQIEGYFSRRDSLSAAAGGLGKSTLIGDINALSVRKKDIVDPNEKTFVGYINGVTKFFQDVIAGDLIKGIGGLGLTIGAGVGLLSASSIKLIFSQSNMIKAIIANTAALWATARGGIGGIVQKGKAGAAASKTKAGPGIKGKIAGLVGGSAGLVTGVGSALAAAAVSMGDILTTALVGATSLAGTGIGSSLWKKFRGKTDGIVPESPISAGDQTVRERTKPHYKMSRGPNGETIWERAGGPDVAKPVETAAPAATPKSTAGKVGGFLKGAGSTLVKGVGPAAMVGSLALPLVDSVTPNFKGKDTLMNGAQGALMGAMVGSIIPGLGTALGAALGGGIGMLMTNLGAEAAQTADANTPSVAAPPAEGWTPVVAAVNSGFDRSVNATQDVVTVVRQVRDVLAQIQHGLDKGGGIVRSRIDQATMTPMVPGARLF